MFEMGGGGDLTGGGDRDWHAIGVGIANLANLVNEAKRLSFFGAQSSGWGNPVHCIEQTGARLCDALNNVSSELNVIAQTLNRLVDHSEGLAAVERPVVFVQDKPDSELAGQSLPRQEHGDSSTSDLSDRMDSDRYG